MNKKIIRFLCLGVLLSILISGYAFGAEDFVVTDFKPQGQVKEGTPHITVVFSSPVTTTDSWPIIIRPELPAEGTWNDSQTFTLKPLAPLSPATQYNVELKENIRDQKGRLLAGRHTFSFNTEPLSFMEARQVDFTEDGSATLELIFSLPVSPIRLRGFATLKDSLGRSVPYAVIGERPSRSISLTTRSFDGDSLTLNIASGLTSESGPLPLEKEILQKISLSKRLTIRSSWAYAQSPRRGSITMQTSTPVDVAKAKNYISLEPEIPFTVNPEYSGFSIEGAFQPRQRYVVTLKKGLAARSGSTLEEDFIKAFVFSDIDAAIDFPNAGMFLTPAEDLRIPIETVNINEVDLTLWRLYENNISYAMLTGTNAIPRELSRLVVQKKARISGAPNKIERRAVDIRDLAKDHKGVFLLTAKNADPNTWQEAQQVVAVTDIGIVARTYSEGIMVWVNSIQKLTPTSRANVRIYSRSNQLIAEGKTGRDGVFMLHRTSPWDDNQHPYLLTVEKDDDLSFLRLDRNILADNGFDISGRPYLRKGYEAFCFAPRNIFRPGETAQFKAIVRDEKRQAPKPFPLLVTIRSGNGKELARSTAELSKEGTLLYSWAVPENSMTGTYQLALSLPGNEKAPLGTMTFYIEEFAPPRLEVAIDESIKTLEPREDVTLSFSSQYLFGAPASDLPWEAEVRTMPVSFTNSQWAAYTFGDAEKEHKSITEFIGQGNLDEEGKGTLNYTIKEGLEAPSILHFLFTVKVREEGGRWVPETIKIPYYPTLYMLGIEKSKETPVPQKPYEMRVAAVTPDGGAAPLNSVTASVAKVMKHYTLKRYGDQTRMEEQEEIGTPDVKEIALSEGIGTFSFTPQDPGEYLVRFEDQATGSSASTRLEVWYAFGEGDGGSPLIDRVLLSTDKEKYVPGETATIQIRSPFEGLLLFTVETDKQITRKIEEIKSGETTLKVKITDEMIPNAYCTAWVIRPVSEKDYDAWGAHRALGTVPLVVDSPESHLSVSIESSEEVEPGKTLPVTIQLKNYQDKPVKGHVALALVDEGILGLTGYATPSPDTFFLSKRELSPLTNDMYDQLMPLESRKTQQLHPAGGDSAEAMYSAAMGGLLSPLLTGKSFTILSLFEGDIETDNDGKASISLDIPEFSGKGRLMAIAATDSAFGSASRPVIIQRDIVVETTLPRAVAPKDCLMMPITVFSRSDKEQKVTLQIIETKGLTVEENNTLSLTVPANGRTHTEVPVFIGEKAQIGSLDIKTTWGEKSFTLSKEITIRPPFPRISIVKNGTISEEGDHFLHIDTSWFPGTQKGTLLLSGLPTANLTGAFNFVRTYPYDCLEQTVSKGWPLLVLPDLAQKLDPLLTSEKEVKEQLEAILRRLANLQLFDGSFASWSGDGIADMWGSIYATHFLVEASQKNIPISETLLSGALSYMRQILSLSDEEGADGFSTRAYAAYVLTLHGEPPLGWMEHLKSQKENMKDSGRIFLAGAYALYSKNTAPLKELGDVVAPTDEEKEETTPGKTFELYWRNRALLLLMWNSLDPMAPETTALASGLIQNMKKEGWSTTQENAFALIALGRYIEKTYALQKEPFTADILAADGTTLAKTTEKESTAISLDDVATDLKLQKRGNGVLHYGMTLSGIPTTPQDPYNKGIEVERLIKEHASLGEKITVELHIRPQAPITSLVLSDILPGGVEIESAGEIYFMPASGANVRAEKRDDRLILFISNIEESLIYRYTVRAVTKGTFALPPVYIEDMYNPGVRSLSRGGIFTIE